ncbi:MAG: hypothetical protein U0T82_11875 [Bacteroidales bacterium]
MCSLFITKPANFIMDSFILAYIASRMKQLEHKEYYIEPYLAVIPEGETEYVVNVYNEFFFLNSRELPVGTDMLADNNHFKVEDYYSYMELTKVQEFSGQLRITIPPGSPAAIFEFIRVVPMTLTPP